MAIVLTDGNPDANRIITMWRWEYCTLHEFCRVYGFDYDMVRERLWGMAVSPMKQFGDAHFASAHTLCSRLGEELPKGCDRNLVIMLH